MTTFSPTAAMPTEPTEYESPVFEWDDWKASALEGGLDEELADLGRAVYREALNHGWPWSLRVVCCDPTLTEMLTKAPATARKFYETMLATDGFRFAFVESETSSEMIELCTL